MGYTQPSHVGWAKGRVFFVRKWWGCCSIVKSKSCLSYWTGATTIHGWNGGEELAVLGGLVKGRRFLVWSLLRTLAGASWGYSGEGKESTIFITMGADDDMRKENHEGEGLLSLVMAGCVVTVRRKLKRKQG